jgi:GNAT superfamily N-acetyltransferase
MALVDDVFYIWTESFQEASKGFNIDFSQASMRRIFDERIWSADDIYTLQQGSKTKGFIHMSPERDEVHRIYVLPEAWGQGYGKGLLFLAEGLGKAKGHEVISLWTGITNDRSQKFYESQGWEITNELKDVILCDQTFPFMKYNKRIHHQ